MLSRVESALAAEMVQVFQQVHGNIPFRLEFVADVAGVPGCSTFGVCDFGQVPPVIEIRAGLGETDLIENLCHEFAHLVSGYAAGNNEL